MKARRLRPRRGWRSFLGAFASICRIRSRVTSNRLPTSSRVCSPSSPMPNRRRRISFSFGESIDSARSTCVLRSWLSNDSLGEPADLSSRKSPSSESSPIGVSSESGLRDDSRMRSEEHTSELQSRLHLVCRLLLEKKKKKKTHTLDNKNKRRTQG